MILLKLLGAMQLHIIIFFVLVVNGSFSEEFKTAVIDLYVNGCPYTQIARELGVSNGGLWKLVKKFPKEIKEKHVLTRAKGNFKVKTKIYIFLIPTQVLHVNKVLITTLLDIHS